MQVYLALLLEADIVKKNKITHIQKPQKRTGSFAPVMIMKFDHCLASKYLNY